MSSEGVPTWLSSVFEAFWATVSAWQFWIGAAVPFLLWLALRRRFRTSSVSVGLPFGLGSVTFDTTSADRVLAWRFHVQLVTRKAALPFDEDGDVIKEIFDSLHELFGIARTLLSDLPPTKRMEGHGVSTLVIGVLNSGVRPLLTRWHADFRRWWDRELDATENLQKSPQEIQRHYPNYDELVADLGRANTELSKFADELLDIASGRLARVTPRRRRVKARPPTLSEQEENTAKSG